MKRKLKNLQGILKSMGSVLVAFSGGTDSAFLLKAAKDALGNNVLAATAFSDFFPAAELAHARHCAQKLDARHLILRYKPPIRVWKNSLNRCYYCKRKLFSYLLRIARKKNIQCVIEGSIFDDMKDFRPGNKALRELKIRSPLREAGLTKKDIRRFSRRMGLKTWNKPPSPCLASRFPYGQAITLRKVRMVEDAEECIRRFGVSSIRVRHHGDIARIETARQDMPLLIKNRKEISRKLKGIGFTYSAVDLDGYRQGSLNEGMQWKRKK